MSKTKIVATLGPASGDIETIKKLINSGMSAARINFSHGDYESHGVVINNLKAAREELDAPIALILDTKGPEIRIKTFNEDKIYLKQGAEFTLTTRDIVGDETIVSVTYQDLAKDLQVGSRVLIDDGLIELKVRELTDTDIICGVINAGFLSSRKGVNIPDVYVNLPSLTEKDIEDIKFGITMEFDYIAASFIRSANDVLKIREVLETNGGGDIKIIAKIESRDGVTNLDSILEVADGIMVARGDLGVEIPPEEVPLVQKLLIKKSNQMGKPVITATQMLESMVNNPRPTRAEANDVANAIFDGSDAIMLSGETAKGDYPVESVAMMKRIAERTEGSINYFAKMTETNTYFKRNITNAISFATCTTANDLKTACIVTVTDSGFTARSVSKFKPGCPVVAVTQNTKIWRQLNLTWGCFPVIAEILKGNEEVFDVAESKAIECGIAKDGDAIVIVAGVPVGIAGTTNTLKVLIAGSVLVKGQGHGYGIVSGKANVIKVKEEGDHYFNKGDILVTTKTDDDMMPFIRKASAIVVGSWEMTDTSHAVTVGNALNIPVIVCDVNAVDLIPDGLLVTVDAEKGLVYNGTKNK